MVSKKDRRHSGYITPVVFIPKKELEKNDIFIEDYYNPWANYRDGHRNLLGDKSKIKRINFAFDEDLFFKIVKNNKKLKKMEKIRKARKIVN